MTMQFKRHVSLLLSFVIAMMLLPVFGTAQELLDQEIETQPMIHEVTSLREKYVKHFALPDGTYQAVTYSEPVHELDANGQWQDIDNTLQLVNTKGVESYFNANSGIAFAKSFSPNQTLFSIDDGNYAISMSVLQGTSGVEVMSTAAISSEAFVNNANPRIADVFSSVEEAAMFDTSSMITYTDALPGVDLEYIIKGRSVKENIVVKARSDSYSYRFALELEGLSARQEEDGGIILYDPITDEIKYVIPTGLMYDANETVSYDVTYTLTQSAGKYWFTVSADAEWINAEEREWPVTIDPTIAADSLIHDTYLRADYPNATHGTSSVLWLSREPSSVGASEVLIRGDQGKLPDNARINSAYMKMYYYYNDSVTAGSYNLSVYSVHTYWTEGAATWNNTRDLVLSDSPIGEVYTNAAYNATINNPRAVTVSITSLAESWHNGRSNCGVKLVYSEGTNLSVCLRSSESGSEYSPHFYVNYSVDRLPDGIYSLESGAGPKIAKCVIPAEGSESSVIPQQASVPSNYSDDYLFKFKYLGTVSGEDCYSIRPMLNSGLGLSAPVNGGVAAFEELTPVETLAGVPVAQRWVVTYEDGRYRIRNGSNGSGAYLSIPTSSNSSGSTDQLQAVTTPTVASGWIISARSTLTSRAVFVEAPEQVKVNETAQFSAIVQSNQPGQNGPIQYSVVNEDGTSTNLAQIDASGVLAANGCGVVKVRATFAGANQTVSQTVYLYEYRKNMAVYYDYGYASRFVDAQARIGTQLEVLKRFYLNEFGLLVNSSVIGVYTSSADLCINDGEDYDSECSCLGEDTKCNDATFEGGIFVPSTHHKNITNMVYELGAPPSGFDFRITYSGHVCCYNKSPVEHFEGFDAVRGWACEANRVACVANRLSGTGPETFTLVHEFGHFFGADDHYYDDIEGRNDCVFGLNKDSYANGSEYELCDVCRQTIANALSWSEP